MMTMKTTTMKKMRAWNSAKITTHQPPSKQLQLKIQQRKRPRIPKMAATIDQESPSFSKMPIMALETPRSRRASAKIENPTMAMVLNSKQRNNTTMIVLITVEVAMIVAIVDTKVAKTMVDVATIITDAMTTEVTVVSGAITTNTEMIAVVEATAATERIVVAATTIETEEVAKATMIKVVIEATVVSRIVVPEETILDNNSHTISSTGIKLILSRIIDFTTRTILISSVEP